MNQFDGKVAVVTGATSGIGAATAKLFAQRGAKVILIGRNEERGTKIVNEIESQGGIAKFFSCDVSDESQVKAFAEAEKGRFLDRIRQHRDPLPLQVQDGDNTAPLLGIDHGPGRENRYPAEGKPLLTFAGLGDIAEEINLTLLQLFQSLGPGEGHVDQLPALALGDVFEDINVNPGGFAGLIHEDRRLGLIHCDPYCWVGGVRLRWEKEEKQQKEKEPLQAIQGETCWSFARRHHRVPLCVV